MRDVVVLLGFLTFFSCEKNNANKLMGAWQVDEIHWITSDTTYSIKNAQPGVFLVSDSAYSFIWTPINEKRKAFKKLAEPTVEEMIYGFQSIVLNAGTYKKTDSTFIINALVSKVPGFEGGKQTFNYKIIDDRLELRMIDETYPDGQKPNWFGRVETLFRMNKLD